MKTLFDNTRPNIILISDVTDKVVMQKSYGPYKVAYELRRHGYEVLVIHHAHVFSVQDILDMLSVAVSEHTLFIGINNMFYRSFSFDHSIVDPQDGDMQIAHSMDRMLGAFLPHGREYNSALRDHVAALNPNCKWVLGGPTADDDGINRDFDYVVVGYAEHSAINLARHLENGEPLMRHHRSLWGFTVVDDARAEGFDFAASTMSYCDTDGILDGDLLPLETARGCIFSCAFCSYPLNGKKRLDFIKCGDLLYQELMENYQRWGITRYVLMDDTFNDNVDKIRMMHDISQRLPFRLEYWAYIRLDLLVAHPETVSLLYESGLRGAWFGIETMNARTASAIGKGGSREKLVRKLEQLRTEWPDVWITCSFVIGLPHETTESAMQTVEWLHQPDCPVKSYSVIAFRLYTNNSKFPSKIEADPARYGYRVGDQLAEDGNMAYWSNEHMDYHEAERIAALADTVDRPITSFHVFAVMGLNAWTHMAQPMFGWPMRDLDWQTLTKLKWQRAREYRSRMRKVVGLDAS